MNRHIDIAAIEEEFGRSIKRLVEDWRRYGSTYRTIAAALGISERTLRRWRKHWGMEIHQQPYGPDRKRDEFSRPEHKVEKKARELGFDDVADLMRCYKLDPHFLTDEEIAAILGCGIATVWRHKPKELRGHRNISKEGLEKLRECGKRNGGKVIPNHPWRWESDAHV